ACAGRPCHYSTVIVAGSYSRGIDGVDAFDPNNRFVEFVRLRKLAAAIRLPTPAGAKPTA
ncbi:hypothetical protein, partial [Mesorhizobium sp.]|uniref:hypothetical protein n=1 Tax=Mesorhizobium sp. TaxID=1871066 RepID=UPI0025BE6FE2